MDRKSFKLEMDEYSDDEFFVGFSSYAFFKVKRVRNYLYNLKPD